jgi:hypothetical protein
MIGSNLWSDIHQVDPFWHCLRSELDRLWCHPEKPAITQQVVNVLVRRTRVETQNVRQAKRMCYCMYCMYFVQHPTCSTCSDTSLWVPTLVRHQISGIFRPKNSNMYCSALRCRLLNMAASRLRSLEASLHIGANRSVSTSSSPTYWT